MFQVQGNTIRMTRGDTVVLSLQIENYTITENDEIVLTVKKNINAKNELFHKDITADNKFIINPADTQGLPYGTYVYDVQLTTATGDVHTVIEPHNFVLDGEVTW